MAQVLSNILPKSPTTGLLSTPPKTNIASGLSINPSGQVAGGYTQPSNATVAGLLTSGIAPKTTTPTTTKAPVAPYASTTTSNTSTPTTSTAPIIGGPNSGGTINPNANYYAGQSNGTVPGLYPDILSSLRQVSTTVNPMTQDAYKAAQDTLQKLNQSQLNEAKGTATILGQAIPLGDQEGQARVLQDQYLKQQQALSNLYSGQTNLLGAGQTQQQLAQSGLGTIAGQAPEALRYGAFGGGNLGGGLTGNYSQDIGGAAQTIMQNPALYASYADSLNGFYGSTAKSNLDAAIIKAGGNPTALAAQSAALQSNVQQTGTAATDIARAGLSNAIQNYVNANTAFKQAEGQSQNLLNSMDTINNISSRYANTAVNNLRSQFGDTNFVNFITSLSEAQQAYTQLLASVGAATPTVNGQQATLILDPSYTPAQIKAAITALNNAASAKLGPLYEQINQYQQNLGGGSYAPATQTGTLTWDTI